MAYAVTCSSCGARFSVAEDLFQKKFAGRVVTVRCKQCHASIRLNATVPPRRSDPPAKPGTAAAPPRANAARRVRPVPPRPPQKSEDRDSPGPFVALSPGLLGTPSLPDDPKNLFDAPPPSPRPMVDLTDAAKSEPPSRRNARRSPDESVSDDMDFLLGLSGSPGITATLLGPPILSLAEPPIEPSAPTSSPEPVTARSPSTAARAPSAAQAPPGPGPEPARSRLGVLALTALAIVAVALLLRSVLAEKSADTPTATPTAAELSPTPAATRTPPAPEPPTSAPREPELEIEPAAEPPSNAIAAPTRRAATKPPAESAPAPEPAKTPDAPAPAPAASAPAAPTEPFSKAAATSALGAAANEASACRKPGDPSGTASVVVTFAPSGRVTSATISGPPFAGTPTGGCIAATLRRARVPAFEGDKVTVGKTVVID